MSEEKETETEKEERFVEVFERLVSTGRISLSGNVERGTFDEDGTWLTINLEVDGEVLGSVTVPL